jgi:hypothetical protein
MALSGKRPNKFEIKKHPQELPLDEPETKEHPHELLSDEPETKEHRHELLSDEPETKEHRHELLSDEPEAKEHRHEPPLEEVMPTWMPQPVFDIMSVYLKDDIRISSSSYANNRRLTIFGKDVLGHLYHQAQIIARNYVLPAADLDRLKTMIEKNPNVLVPTIEIGGKRGTLLQLAIIGLDQAITSKSTNTVEYKAMDRLLMECHEQWLPDTVPDALKKAREASFFEAKEDESKSSLKQLEVLNEAFDMIKDEEPSAGSIVKKYLKSIKPTQMSNREYHLNVLRLLCRAFDLFRKKGRDFENEWYGAQADRFRLEVIGGAIQPELPPRLRQILISGLYSLFYENRNAERVVDPEGVLFRSAYGSVLGVDYFYDDNGRCHKADQLQPFLKTPFVYDDLFEAVVSASNVYEEQNIIQPKNRWWCSIL